MEAQVKSWDRTVEWVLGELSIPDSCGIVLLYHRVARLRQDPQLLSVTPEHFEEQMDYLEERFRVVDLRELVRLAVRRRIQERLVSITFDDGYRDDAFVARRILRKRGLQAALFVTTGLLESQDEFWVDQLEKIFLSPGSLPATLQIRVDGRGYEWDLEEHSDYSLADYEQHAGWNILSREDPTPRHKTYRDLCNLLRRLHPRERDSVINKLLDWSGIEHGARPTHRTLGRQDLSRLVAGGVIEIGSHTVSHPMLSRLSRSDQEAEIRQSKTALEELLGRTVIGFSYPYGSWSDYRKETVRLVEEAGFSYACTTIQRLVAVDVDPYQLPRFVVRDWGASELAAHMEEWLYG